MGLSFPPAIAENHLTRSISNFLGHGEQDSGDNFDDKLESDWRGLNSSISMTRRLTIQTLQLLPPRLPLDHMRENIFL